MYIWKNFVHRWEVNIIFSRNISAEQIFEIENSCIVDLRSESEYKNGTIYGAMNIPILNDKEREEVGYVYVNKSVCEAKKLGLRYAGYKLESIFEKISHEFSLNKNMILFCSRGGMRSLSVHNLFNSIGIKNYKLDKGYKGYRKFLRDKFPEILQKINFVVIHGKTGIGKTKVLNMLKNEGYPVIDLEFAANHRASFLGGVNLGEQNSQKQFESTVFHKVMEIVGNKRFSENEKINVFIEGESKRIGKIIIPEYIFSAMNDGIHICVDLPIDVRVKNLMEDYFKIDEDSLKRKDYEVRKNILDDFENNMFFLQKYSSKNDMQRYFSLFKEKNYEELAVSLIENYYDSKYINSMKKHEFKFNLEVSTIDEFLNEMKKIYDYV